MSKKKDSKEIPHNSIDIQPLTNTSTWQSFLENDAFMLFPGKDDWRKRFACTLLTWASKEDSVEITDFALEMKMRRSTINEWAAKYPDLKDAYDQARLMIASRRKKGALIRKYDKDVVFKDLHRYDPEWLEINKYHSDMKKDEDKQNHTFIINDAKPRIVTKQEMRSNSEED